jgi:uncharacterized protein YlxW (UPF0749 family)
MIFQVETQTNIELQTDKKNKQTDRQTNKHTNRQTNQQTLNQRLNYGHAELNTHIEDRKRHRKCFERGMEMVNQMVPK